MERYPYLKVGTAYRHIIIAVPSFVVVLSWEVSKVQMIEVSWYRADVTMNSCTRVQVRFRIVKTIAPGA